MTGVMFYSALLNTLNFKYFSGNTVAMTTTDPRWDRPFALITQFVGGRVALETEDAYVELEPEEALIVPPYIKHKLTLLDGQATSRYLNLNITLFGHVSLFTLIAAPLRTSREHGRQIGRIQQDIVRLMNAGNIDPAGSLLAMAQVKRRLCELLELLLSISDYRIGSFEDIRHFQRFQPVLDYVASHQSAKIKVADLAELMYLSASHFHHEFKQAFRISPLQYVRRERLKHAQFLLATTNLSVKQVANLLGYDSSYPFIRFFKSVYGSSPGQYKKAMAASFSDPRNTKGAPDDE